MLDVIQAQMRAVEEHMATKDDLAGMATKEDLAGMATKEDLKHVATRLDLDDLRHEVASKSDLAAMERRLTDSISERLADDHTQYDEIEKLKGRVRRLETQVKTLTGGGRKKQ